MEDVKITLSAYDKFLIVVSLVFNVLTFWYAWRWV